MFDPKDIIGDVFGQLTVRRLLPRAQRNRRGRYDYRYLCDCSCGRQTTVVRNNLLHAHTRSCGCLKHRSGAENPGWKGHGGISGYHWARIRHHATDRKLPFTISMVEAWELFQAQQSRCALTGWRLRLGLSSKKKSTCTASLDRIDSSKGYERGNVQWVHKDVNQVKWDLTNERFIAVCVAVARHVGEGT